jgi:hypothetical protein
LEYIAAVECDRQNSFITQLVEQIVTSNSEVVGFSSICSSYPLTIRLGHLLKKAAPDVKILLGGPQASVVDIETLTAFPWFDFIVRGEADVSLLKLLDAIAEGRDCSTVEGLTYLGPAGIQRTPNAVLLDNLDCIDPPAYHLYAASRQIDRFPLELGRGCPFSCEFCSTNLFFSKRFRLRSPAVVFSEMLFVASKYKITDFELVHDMFTVDRKRVVAFCEYLTENHSSFTWSCSARTDMVDEELLRLMYEAGCRGVFFGVETGSQRLQRVIKKDLDIGEARKMAEVADQLGMNTTTSLITGFSEETMEDFQDTINFFIDMLKFRSVEPQLHILSPLPGTPISTRLAEQLTLGEELSDIAFNGNMPDTEDVILVRDHPSIFSAYLKVPSTLDRSEIVALRDFLMNARWQIRYVLYLLHAGGINLVDFFGAWREEFADQYGRWSVVQKNARFLEKALMCVPVLPTNCQPIFLSLVNFVQKINDQLERLNISPACVTTRVEREMSEIRGDQIPRLRQDILLHDFEGNYEALCESLRQTGGMDPTYESTTAQPLLVRFRANQEIAVEALPVPTSVLLRLCTGSATVDDIIRDATQSGIFAAIPEKKVPAYIRLGLHILAQQSVIGFYHSNELN